ncbi:hypothetical protein ADIARSV_2659 [Arcticibacter svalbardensis MN12-7]|uniref:Uncharacterized protein n=1 Tax=Arcticibacter svalbardensis MN12-7 TaxID=1150600 RepID=R9GYZ3_9SPHI|nr:hypothetical protein ADIARSV_2659 [Arcticibacter svalbardensis MN12-7]
MLILKFFFDITGRILYSINKAGSENTITLDNNFKGVGIVVVEKQVKKAAKRIIIE